MIKRILTSLMVAGMLLGATGCNKGVNKGEENAAEVEAAFIEGREAARKFVNRPWRDTTELQGQLLEARTGSSEYTKASKPRCAAAYDSAFVSTLKTVRPELARELLKTENQGK